MSTVSQRIENESSQTLMKKRLFILFGIVCLGFLCVSVKLSWVQVINNSWYKGKALSQRMRPIPVDAIRGNIVDRNGKELAVSVSAESVYCIPSEVMDPEGTADKLAAVLEMDRNSILSKLTASQQTVWVKRKVDSEVASEVRKLSLAGIALTESS